MRKKLSLLLVIFAVCIFGTFSVAGTGWESFKKTKQQGGPALKSGDIIFIVNPAGQGKAIQLATKSKYTHVGIVFI
jgi:hypothetical protein